MYRVFSVVDWTSKRSTVSLSEVFKIEISHQDTQVSSVSVSGIAVVCGYHMVNRWKLWGSDKMRSVDVALDDVHASHHAQHLARFAQSSRITTTYSTRDSFM